MLNKYSNILAIYTCYIYCTIINKLYTDLYDNLDVILIVYYWQNVLWI
jgi:hypothetical protein